MRLVCLKELSERHDSVGMNLRLLQRNDEKKVEI